jgi:hypothetical protein
MSQVTNKFHNPAFDIWRVDEPDVKNRESTYPEIQFQRGDRVQIIDAGGCCQTGGVGATWKRWVNPSGPNSAGLYHGLIKVPGMPALARVQDIGNQVLVVPNDYQGDLSLHLGYEDDDYSDNGYWGRDDGTGDQCAGQSNAYIELLLLHTLGISTLEQSPNVSEASVVLQPGSWTTRQ